MRLSSSSHVEPTRVVLLGRIIAGLLLVSGVAAAVLQNPTVVSGATTTSTTTNAFPVSTDKPSYVGSATIVVSGVDASANGGISIVINNPRNAPVTSQNVGVAQNGSFSATFQATWPIWNVSGVYRVTVIAPIADFVGAPPTSYVSFNYTAVATTSSTASSTTSSSGTGTGGGDSSSTASILVVVLIIVVAVGLVGFMLRSRGRRRPAASTAPATKQAPRA
jgi:hypothetical protein